MSILEKLTDKNPSAVKQEIAARQEANRERALADHERVTRELAAVALPSGIVRAEDSLAIHHNEPIPSQEHPAVQVSQASPEDQ